MIHIYVQLENDKMFITNKNYMLLNNNKVVHLTERLRRQKKMYDCFCYDSYMLSQKQTIDNVHIYLTFCIPYVLHLSFTHTYNA